MKRQLIFLLLFIFLFCQQAYGDEAKVRIAIIDTGISSESIDNENIVDGANYMDSSGTNDLLGHGTAVAGIIVGSEGIGINGIAPKAKLVPLVISTINKDGQTLIADCDILAQTILDAIDIYGCKIINISAGILSDDDVLENAVKYAEQKGVVLVSSVGNDNEKFTENIYYPAAYDTVIGVGALKKDGQVAIFSQRNYSLSICAPGDRLKLSSISYGKTAYGFGTSYATAYVSAAAVLFLEKYPDFSPKEIRQILYISADDLEQVGYDTNSGWGSLNIDSALEYSSRFDFISSKISIIKNIFHSGLPLLSIVLFF